MTNGEWIVGVSFNPSGNALVDEIKALTSELIDIIIDEVLPHTNDESSALLAMKDYENAAMWAVKAITKQPHPLDPNYKGS
jgi:hypothetical protein